LRARARDRGAHLTAAGHNRITIHVVRRGGHVEIFAVLAVSAMVVGAGAADGARRTITRQDAQAVATAINLRHSDLPSFAQHPNPITADQKRLNASLGKCVGGVPDTDALAKVQSPSFVSPGSGSATVSSEALIMPSQALVAKDLAAITGPRAIGCLRSQLSTEIRASLPKGDSLVSIAGSRVTSVVSGADGTFAYRFKFVLGVKQGTKTTKVPAYGDFVGFTYGQAQASFSVQTELTPPSAAFERQVAARLVSRARAAIG
jgi:hypothetical protein